MELGYRQFVNIFHIVVVVLLLYFSAEYIGQCKLNEFGVDNKSTSLDSILYLTAGGVLLYHGYLLFQHMRQS